MLSARRPIAQMREVRDRLSRAHGRVLDVAGEQVAALPTPEQLLGVRSFPGIPDVKLRRMHAIAVAALDGRLDTESLRMRDVGEVDAELRGFEGIGPFYAELVTIRALGHTDVLPDHRAASGRRDGGPAGPGVPQPCGLRRGRRGLAPVADLGLRRPPRRRLRSGSSA